MRVESSHQHQRFVKEFADPVAIGFNADDTVLSERIGTVSQQSDGSQDVGNHQRFENVQFEMSITAADGHSHVISHYLSGHHRDGLTLSWIHFAYRKQNYFIPINESILKSGYNHKNISFFFQEKIGKIPGMILEPGSFSGRDNSPNPQRGPDAKKRISLAIFIRLAATVFNDPDICTRAS